MHQQMPSLVANKLGTHFTNHPKPEPTVFQQPNQASQTSTQVHQEQLLTPETNYITIE